MRSLHLTIVGRRFVLSSGARADDLTRQIVDAVRAGGAMIEVPDAQALTVTALVTPTTAVFLDVVDVPEPTTETDEGSGGYDYAESVHGLRGERGGGWKTSEAQRRGRWASLA